MHECRLQALQWTADGELDPRDQITVINRLIPECLPTAQLELIQLLEKLATRQRLGTRQVSVC